MAHPALSSGISGSKVEIQHFLEIAKTPTAGSPLRSELGFGISPKNSAESNEFNNFEA